MIGTPAMIDSMTELIPQCVYSASEDQPTATILVDFSPKTSPSLRGAEP